MTDAVEAKRRLAFMPDEPHLFDYLTVREHLEPDRAPLPASTAPSARAARCSRNSS